MKKIYFILAISSMLLLTGCTKNYKSVNEYATAMETIKKAQTSYTIEAKQKVGTIEFYYKSYIKGDKWKTETSMNGGSSIMSTTLYDGEELLTYAEGSPYAMKNPAMDMINEETAESKTFIINSQNPVYPILYWKDGFNIFTMGESENPTFLNNKDNRNGFDCRLIKFSNEREACISDTYGVAAYHKVLVEDIKNKGSKQETTIDLVKISTSELDDSTFELPKGVKKMDLDSMLGELKNMFKM